MKILILPGDGIGSEIVTQAVRVLEKFKMEGAPITLSHGHLGGAAYDAHGHPYPEATQLLAGIPYQSNTAILHTDQRLLPDRQRAWAAWNFMAWDAKTAGARGQTNSASPVSLSYLINRLQPLPFKTPVIVTMNPLIAPERGKIIREMTYEHPVFLAGSDTTKRSLRKLQGRRRMWFAGAWTRHGFHEDGLMSGIAVAKALGAKVPWKTDVPAANDLASAYPGVDA